jgi:F-type H+-transporting ATPase subunit b
MRDPIVTILTACILLLILIAVAVGLMTADKTDEGSRPDLPVFTAVVSLVLLLVLVRFAGRPVVDGLDKREQSIAGQIEEARRGVEEASESLRKYEAQAAAVADEVNEMMADARQTAEAAKEKILAEAEAASARERARAVADVGGAKDAALRELAEKGADIAVKLAGQIVRQELNSEDQARLVREAVERFPSRN